MSESELTVYNIQILSGIAKVQECINIDILLRVKLSFEGLAIPLPEYIRNSANCKVTSLDMLTNLPNYCGNLLVRMMVVISKSYKSYLILLTTILKEDQSTRITHSNSLY